MPRSSAVLESLNRASREASNRIVSEALATLSPSTEIGKLIDEFSKSDFNDHFRSMTFAELLTAAGGAAPAKRRGRPRGARPAAAPRKSKSKAKSKGINTRTAAGRAALDGALAEHLARTGSAGSEELQKALGVSAAQIRQSVKRQSRSIKVTGQKRATRYHWKATSGGSGAKKASSRKKTARRKKAAKKG